MKNPIQFLLQIGFGLLLSSPLVSFGAEPRATALEILEKNCLECHGGKFVRHGLDLSTKENSLNPGESGEPAIVPGKADQSLLFKKITHTDKPGMPYQREKLADDEISVLKNWINAGANYERPLSKEKWKNKFWSLLPLQKIEPPKIKNSRWVKTPIDQFILAKLQEKGMTPSAPANKKTLLRRITYDLTGLPPTANEVQNFLHDKSPKDFERVVDRLLASPRYGERWARHWLDVVHYADTHGHSQDRPRSNAWPFRDYVIQSFNNDKPYARFVEEQLAGDVLFPENPDGIVATGFIAAGPWDDSSQVYLTEGGFDKRQAQNLDRDDMVMTTMSTFSSSTVHCARCHNHKFDPILQKEYYNLQAVFAGIDRVDRPYDLDPKTNALRQALLKRKTALDVNLKGKALLAPTIQSEVAAWEKEIGYGVINWTVLDPASFKSEGGATLTKQSDFSFLASGTRAETDVYTITATTDLTNITAVRVEVLSDENLPLKGPGRSDNGNLTLTEFQLKAAPKAEPDSAKVVTVQNPSADFNQKYDGVDWDVTKTLDNNPKTGWAIFPEVGRSHFAIFELKESINFKGGAVLTFVLEQKWKDHSIGKLRLSVTSAAPPVKVNPFPEIIAKILAIKNAERTDEQKIELAAHYLKTRVDQQLAALPEPKLVYAVANDFAPRLIFKPAKTPRPIFLLKRGDIDKPAEPASPGALSLVKDLKSEFDLADSNDEGSRRAALAKWITNPKNVLTWRSIVNRVWHYHFGRGIVDSPNDFGEMGSRPTHPELLDYLATSFLESGGSIKKLHKMILLSAVYQQSSEHNAAFKEIDSGNFYLWRMNRSRLDAEELRDTILQLTGKLDLKIGGPADMQFKLDDPAPPVTPVVDYTKFDVDSSANFRRSIYRYIYRTLPDPFMDTLDCADASQLTPTRNVSMTALQALAMMNNQFVLRQSEHLADRVSKSGNIEKQIESLYQLVLERAPTRSELMDLKNYATEHGMANACRIILNSNEFIFVN